MLFPHPNLLLRASTILSLACFGFASDCGEGPFGEAQLSGKTWDRIGGIDYCETRWKDGLLITGIEVWANKHHVRGLQITYDNGLKSPIYGTADGDEDRHDKIAWDATAPVTKVTKWNNIDNDAVGRIRIEVGGKTLEVGANIKKKNDGEDVMVHSGLLLAANGRAGDFMDSLEWKFMGATLQEATMEEITFENSIDTWNSEKRNIEPVSLSEVIFKNSNEKGFNKTFTFRNSKGVTESKVITQTHQQMFGTRVAVLVGGKVGIPLLAEAKTEVTTEVSYQNTRISTEGKQEDNARSFEWSELGPLLPGKAVNCTSFVMRGTFISDYQSVIKIKMVDGNEFQINQPGKSKSVGWAKAVSECKEIPLAEANAAALEVSQPEASPTPTPGADGVNIDLAKRRAVVVEVGGDEPVVVEKRVDVIEVGWDDEQGGDSAPPTKRAIQFYA
ncbi:hypothetical protein BDV95DRAFT_579284 [Massariosphaeria phaeospora]|uniref:Jacalin-type lectin domain-containing protein n=1 Tax=Massariosphaeria phaeospora TaxID=100035 RepID=A0A7C8I5N5_9PLEO|nr:hypothetical protein BDV95DRAFT_579284 [Massariosphaeria phaeospora]